MLGELPSFRCHSCKARLVVRGGSADGALQDRRSDAGGLLSDIDESFIVLDERGRGPGALLAGCPVTAQCCFLLELVVVTALTVSITAG